MTTPPTPPDSGTPADRAAGAMDEDQYLGRDSTADLEADGGADGGADAGPTLTDSLDGDDAAGADDPTTEGDEDSRYA